MKRSEGPETFFEISGKPDGTPIQPISTAAFEGWKDEADANAVSWAEANGFEAGAGKVLLLPDDGGGLGRVLWGLGEKEDLGALEPADFSTLRAALPTGRYSLEADGKGRSSHAALLGWALEAYSFDAFKTEERDDKAQPILVLADQPGLTRTIALLEGIFLTRDLVNTPAGDMGPEALAGAASDLAAEFGAAVSVTVGEDLLSRGFPAVHAVGRAGEGEPRLIEMTWGEPEAPRVTIVGKGVCFDTGGLDLKSAAGMRLMKKDMGGAAVSLGLARAIMASGLPLRLRVIIPAVENNVAANALRPGDIILTRKGLSVEIGNTDAEGRLVLADGLALAEEEPFDLLIDFATLTGAARVALGPDLPAFYSDNDELSEALLSGAKAEWDPVWRMPLWQPYAEDLKSPVADIANITEHAFAGSVTAALFLARFLEDRRNWIHFDIFAWNPTARPGRPKGGEASALRAAFKLIEGYARDS
ncbi:MAG: leucyl aminopeptidase family protein [Sphingomonadales bacterium]